MGNSGQDLGNSKERVILVGVRHPRMPEYEIRDALDELARLAGTAGAEVVDRIICKQVKPHPGFFIGKGKAEEIASALEDLDVETAIFDEDLSPAQARNLEKLMKVKVLDRTQVILDIFALHAQSKAGRLQVELARLEYLLPRLRRMWTHLERQKGGIGLRGGPGEQQIEVDRRIIKTRLVKVRRELEAVRRHRAELRRGRRRHGWALVSLVGYTNAGKSTLLNSLTGSTVRADDQLFVTLDPTTREIRLPNHQSALLTDTVGFIKKLPHHLVEAFKATLEEVVEADLLVNVIDASHPQFEGQMEAVRNVLRDLGAHEKPMLTVFNKIDMVPESDRRWKVMAHGRQNVVAVSARTGQGLDSVLDALADCLRGRYETMCLRIPPKESKLIAAIQAQGHILKSHYEDVGDYIVEVSMPPALGAACAAYRVAENDDEL